MGLNHALRDMIAGPPKSYIFALAGPVSSGLVCFRTLPQVRSIKANPSKDGDAKPRV